MLMKRLTARDENGAVAILAALLAVVLVGISALAIDLGNAFSRKQDVQAQADFAALAGANELGIGNTKSASDPAVIAVRDYFNSNKPQDDHAGPTPDVTAAELVDGPTVDPDKAVTQDYEKNGEVYFTGDRMRVITPQAWVDYGFAGVLPGRFDAVNVRAEASVKIVSGGAVMPFFAVDGCDWGPQTISTPPPGPAPSLTLKPVTDTPSVVLTSISPDTISAAPTPSPPLTINGSGFTGATQVGFFRNDGVTMVPVTISPPASATQIVLPAGAIPSSVTSIEEVWYVRVANASGKWSRVDNAQPLRVGSAVMECVGAMSSGNFGSLLLPRLDSNNSSSGGWLPINISEGLQDPLTLAVHKDAAGPNWNCTDGIDGAVNSTTTGTPTLKSGTNCIDTDTGLPDTSATAGFVTGGTNGTGKTFTGRLDEDTTPGCGAQTSDRNARWATGIHGSGPGHPEYKVNDDLLTCFLDTSVNINTISQDTYSGPPVLSQDIYRSPRFFLQPVLGRKPTCGGCEKYSIVDFRPAFLTDQPTSAVGGSMTMGTSTTHNGLSVTSGKISKVKVVFFNIKALPPPPDDVPISDYIGAGPKLIRLID